MKASFKKRVTYLAIIAAVFVLLAASLLLRRKTESTTFSHALMGTIVQITLYGGTEKANERSAEAAFAEIARLEEVFSSYKTDSDISRISKAAGSMVSVSPEAVEVINKALYVSEISAGAFDPTVGVLSKLWGYSGEGGKVPSKKEVSVLLPFVNHKDIIVDETALKAGLKRKGMVLNLGGVAKGYIVMRAVEVLKNNGVKRGIIHAGGDMAVFQEGKDVPFIIGIQHPREKRLLGEAHVYSGAVATSGDYERFFEKDGVRYHHILDPATGLPATRSRSATIIAEDPTMADALSTAVFVMGAEKGMELIERLDGVEGVIVDSEGKVFTSSGFKGKIF